jgi:hypothetical protein
MQGPTSCWCIAGCDAPEGNHINPPIAFVKNRVEVVTKTEQEAAFFEA